MRNSGFKKLTPEKIKALNEKKRQKAIESRKSPEKRSTGQISGNKRKSKTERQKLEEKIWTECKRITRQRHGNTCYTCGATGLEAHNWQTGHGKPKGALPLQFQYDLRNLRPQCMYDNIHLGGVSDVFIAKLEKEEEGLAFLEEACRKTPEGWIIRKETNLVGKEALIFLRELLAEYKLL